MYEVLNSVLEGAFLLKHLSLWLRWFAKAPGTSDKYIFRQMRGYFVVGSISFYVKGLCR
jgi:hypothetical protein